MTLRHWDSLLSGDGNGGALDLSDGITFGEDDTYQISQERAAPGTEPTEATITGQDASPGDSLPGGALVLAGGAPGEVGQLAGDVVAELGSAVSSTTAALKIRALGADIMSLLQRGGNAAVRAAEDLALQLYSASSVSVEAGNSGVRMLLSDDGLLQVSFTRRVTIADGQLVMSPSGSIPASGNIELDFDVAAKWAFTVNGAVTFTEPQNVVNGATYVVRIEQAPPGSFGATWHSNFKFGSLSSALSTASGAIDIFVFEANEGGWLHCINATKGVHV